MAGVRNRVSQAGRAAPCAWAAAAADRRRRRCRHSPAHTTLPSPSLSSHHQSNRYVKRRARLGFEEARAVTDAGELQRLWQQGKQQLEMVRRQSIVYDLYSHKHKHTMVSWPGW